MFVRLLRVSIFKRLKRYIYIITDNAVIKISDEPTECENIYFDMIRYEGSTKFRPPPKEHGAAP